jgi:hypothetical protein
MNGEDHDDIRDWAERFWLLGEQSEPFPRSLESAVSWALPLVLVKLPRLDVESINDYTRQRGLYLECKAAPRALRGCLLAKGGSGIVFLDGTDPPDEMRFTLAHEVAHFLLDHLKPRQEVINALGSTIQDALNGDREPTPDERLSAMVRGVSFERFEHLMDRTSEGSIARREALRAEDRADLLALELLAPLQCLRESLVKKQVAWSDAQAGDVVEGLLIAEYGLPPDVARNYARFLIARHASAPMFRDWLRGKK